MPRGSNRAFVEAHSANRHPECSVGNTANLRHGAYSKRAIQERIPAAAEHILAQLLDGDDDLDLRPMYVVSR